MNLFLQRKIDSASAMTYNELAQVLESKNPKTGKLYRLSDLNVITMERAGTAMLEDGIFVRGDWIKSTTNQDDREEVPRGVVPGLGVLPRPPRGVHLDRAQELADLPQGAPALDDERDQCADLAGAAGCRRHEPEGVHPHGLISRQFGVIKKLPKGAYRTDLAKAALAALKAKGVDTVGAKWKKANVKVTAGGKG